MKLILQHLIKNIAKVADINNNNNGSNEVLALISK